MSEGRTQKAAKNVAFNLLNQVLTLILAFVSRSVFLWGLGVSYLGINGLFTDVLGLLSLADLGLNTAMVFSFYKPLAEQDHAKMAALTTFYKQVYNIIAFTVSIVGIALIPILPRIINLDHEVPNLEVYYLLSLANIVVTYICVYKTSVLTADQKAYKISKISMIINFAKTIIQIISIALFKSYIIYLTIGCIGNLMINLIASHIATIEYPFVRTRADLSKEEKKSIFNNLRSVIIVKISTVLISATDNLLISVLIGTVAVGYYSNYQLIQNKLYVFYSLFFTSITASVGNLIIKEKAETKYSIFDSEQSLSFMICGIIIPCFTLLSNDFIRLWLGEEFVLSQLTVFAISLSMYLACVLQPLWTFREATGLYRRTKWAMFLCALLNIFLSIALGKIIGITGIIAATSISKLATYVWYEPKILFREYFEKSPILYYKSVLMNILFIVAVIIVLNYIKRTVVIQSWVMWLIEALVIGSTSTILTILTYRRTKGFKLLREKAVSLLRVKQPSKKA